MRTREEDLQRAGAGALSGSKEEQRSRAVAGVGSGGRINSRAELCLRRGEDMGPGARRGLP